MPPIHLAAYRWHTPQARDGAQVGQLLGWISVGDNYEANPTACCAIKLASAPDSIALYGQLRQPCPPWDGLEVAAAAGGSHMHPEAGGNTRITALPYQMQ